MFDVGVLIAVVLWSAVCSWLLRAKATHVLQPPWTLLWGGSLVTVVLCHASEIARVLAASSGDSFYTLLPVHRAGLVVLSTLFLASLFWIMSIKSNWSFRLHYKHRLSLFLAWGVDMVSAVLLFALIYGTSPQAYYTYYSLIIPNLPVQLVTRFDFSPDFYLSLIRVAHASSYADLVAALSFWTLLICLSWRYLLTVTSVPPRTTAARAGFAMGSLCVAYRLGLG